MESKVIRLSGITLEAIEELRDYYISLYDDEILKSCFRNTSIDDFIRHTFEDFLNKRKNK